MSVTATIVRGYRCGDDQLTGNASPAGGQITRLSEAIPDSSTDLAVACAFDKTKIQACYLLSDKAVSLEFNNGTTGVPTITLAAGVPYEWTIDSGAANPFAAANVTVLYVTNASGAVANLECRFVIDPT